MILLYRKTLRNGPQGLRGGLQRCAAPFALATLAPTLAAVTGLTTTEMLETWSEDFGLHSPVLADRGWGQAVAKHALDDFGYPTSVLVDPELQVMEFNVGFGADGWDLYEDLILADIE